MERTPTFKVQGFGNYFLLERIAVGGMAEIFKAKQIGVRGFEKILVIKKILQHLSEDPEFVEMFEDEAKIAAQLTQANIVQIYELGEIDGTLYITMEHVDGKNLRDVTRAAVSNGIHLSIEQCTVIMTEVLRGLDYAHRKPDSNGKPLSIIHRDMSPQNIIVSYEGEVKILDFGIAKAASKISKTEAGVLKGKFSYMSPEQASGKLINQTSDIYACGVIFHELLTSDRLFRAKTDMETLERVKQGIVPLPSEKNHDVPPELDEIVLKALTKDQSKRYQSASQMLTDLNRFAFEKKITYSSQEFAVFMQSLFAPTIAEEKQRLVRALAQIPANPVVQIQAQLQNARTHIAFKRNLTGENAMPSASKEDATQTGRRRSSNSSSSRWLLFFLFLFVAAGATAFYSNQTEILSFWGTSLRGRLDLFQSNSVSSPSVQSNQNVSLGDHKTEPDTSALRPNNENLTNVPSKSETPPLEPARDKGKTVDQILKPLGASGDEDEGDGKADSRRHGSGSVSGDGPIDHPGTVPTSVEKNQALAHSKDPRSVAQKGKNAPLRPSTSNSDAAASTIKSAKRLQEKPEGKTISPTAKSSKPTNSGSKKSIKAAKPSPSLPVTFSKIDIVAPSDGFAQIYVDNISKGTVPGPIARGMSLPEGSHIIRCETSSKIYSGKVLVKSSQRLIVRCQDLK